MIYELAHACIQNWDTFLTVRLLSDPNAYEEREKPTPTQLIDLHETRWDKRAISGSTLSVTLKRTESENSLFIEILCSSSQGN